MRMNNDSEKRFPIPVFFTLPAHMYETPIYEIFYIMEVKLICLLGILVFIKTLTGCPSLGNLVSGQRFEFLLCIIVALRCGSVQTLGSESKETVSRC